MPLKFCHEIAMIGKIFTDDDIMIHLAYSN